MQHAVGPGALQISRNPCDTLSAVGLGSCIAIAAYEPSHSVGGLLHAMLPLARSHKALPARPASFYVDAGLELLLRLCCRSGALRKNIVLYAAGGANVSLGEELFLGSFRIGELNIESLQRSLLASRVTLRGSDLGGIAARTLLLSMDSGAVRVKSGSTERTI